MWILADPPWRFEPYSRVAGMDRAAENHYVASLIAEIEGLRSNRSQPPDESCPLWATAPILPQAIEVMESWDLRN
jgi:hypothetical protein